MKKILSAALAVILICSLSTSSPLASDLYDHDEARLAMSVALAAYNAQDAQYNADIVAKLSELGFGDIVTYHYDDLYDENTAAYAMARNSEELIVAVRGTDGEEWYGNFNICDSGAGDTHYSFDYAAKEIINSINDYLSEQNLTPSHVLVCGHSRGGAVANLVAAKIDDGECDNIAPQNLRAYTFASPTVTVRGNVSDARYLNIFNIVNPDDFVPSSPLARWGYKRYGKDLFIPTLANDPNYASYKERMIALYRSMFGETPLTFDSNATAEVINNLYSMFPTVDDYYNKKIYFNDTFKNITMRSLCTTLAALMIDPSNTQAQTMIIGGLGNEFRTISRYLLNCSDALGGVHTPLAYFAWMQTLSKDELFANRSYASFTLTLPNGGTASIYDTNGKKYAEATLFPYKTAILNSDICSVGGVGFAQFFFPMGQTFNIEISPSAETTVCAAYAQYDSNHIALRRVNYLDVPLQKSLTFNTNSFFEDITPTEDFTNVPDSESTHSITAFGTGRVSGGGVYQRGEIVRVFAMSAITTQFGGWYDDNMLVGGKAEFSYISRGKRDLALKFVDIKHTSMALLMRVSDSDGNDIASHEISTLKAVNVDIRKWKVLDLAAKLYVVSYDEEDALCDIFAKDVLLEADAQSVLVPLDLSDDVKSIKVFLLDGGVTPLGDNAIEIH